MEIPAHFNQGSLPHYSSQPSRESARSYLASCIQREEKKIQGMKTLLSKFPEGELTPEEDQDIWNFLTTRL